ncbi:MAG TPA: hypothetical protein VFJ16_22855 [Longimicrobium sp.]|nr:hypothetical protein [Longimicrobium sp.]
MPDNSWRVLGYDRFAREEYLIGEFPSRALAEAAAREAEHRHERTQDESLRDDVWIVAPEPAAGHAPHEGCSTCGMLGEREHGFQKIGREEEATHLPPSVSQLRVVRDLAPGSGGTLQLLQCPDCSTYYLLREAHEFLYGGSEEEQELTRLSGAAAAEYLQPPPSSG